MKSDWILWDPLAIDLNSTPSRSISWGKHHSTMFPVGKGGDKLKETKSFKEKDVDQGLRMYSRPINALLAQPPRCLSGSSHPLPTRWQSTPVTPDGQETGLKGAFPSADRGARSPFQWGHGLWCSILLSYFRTSFLSRPYFQGHVFYPLLPSLFPNPLRSCSIVSFYSYWRLWQTPNSFKFSLSLTSLWHFRIPQHCIPPLPGFPWQNTILVSSLPLCLGSSASFLNSLSLLSLGEAISNVQPTVLCFQNLGGHSLIISYWVSTELGVGAMKSNKTQSLTAKRLESGDKQGDTDYSSRG